MWFGDISSCTRPTWAYRNIQHHKPIHSLRADTLNTNWLGCSGRTTAFGNTYVTGARVVFRVIYCSAFVQ